MECIIKFKNSNYNKSEFFREISSSKWINCINNEVDTMCLDIFKMKVSLALFKRYIECVYIDSYQQFILYKFLTKVLIHPCLVNIEFRREYVNFLAFCVDALVHNANDVYNLNIEDEDDCNIYSLRYIYTILIENILIEKDDELFNTLIKSAAIMISSDEDVLKFALFHTFATDKFIDKAVKMIESNSTNQFILSHFLYALVIFNSDNIKTDTSFRFPVKTLLLLDKLINFETLDSLNLLLSIMTIVIIFIENVEQGLACINIYELYNIMIMEQNEHFLNQTVSYFTNILYFMCSSGYILNDEFALKMINFYIKNITMQKNVLELIYTCVKYSNVLTDEMLNFIETSVDCFDKIDIINCLLDKHCISSEKFFKSILDEREFYYKDYLIDMFTQVIYKWMKYSYINKLGFDKIISSYNYLDVLYINNPCMNYVRHNLVYISLQDKCKLYVLDNVSTFSQHDLNEINFIWNF